MTEISDFASGGIRAGCESKKIVTQPGKPAGQSQPTADPLAPEPYTGTLIDSLVAHTIKKMDGAR